MSVGKHNTLLRRRRRRRRRRRGRGRGHISFRPFPTLLVLSPPPSLFTPSLSWVSKGHGVCHGHRQSGRKQSGCGNLMEERRQQCLAEAHDFFSGEDFFWVQIKSGETIALA